jgi:hypothetical protein
MFRNFKKGGYHLEGTKVTGDRLISLLILISIAYYDTNSICFLANIVSPLVSSQEFERLEHLEKRYPYLAEQSYYEGIEEKLIADIDKIINDYK